jgi:hypothetical protein
MAPLPSSFSIKNGPNSCPASMGNLMVRREIRCLRATPEN